MSYEDDGDSFCVEFFEHLHHFDTGFGVEVSGGFIGEDHRRTVDQCSGNGYALLLTAGKLGRVVSGAVGDTDLLQSRQSPPSFFFGGKV